MREWWKNATGIQKAMAVLGAIIVVGWVANTSADSGGSSTGVANLDLPSTAGRCEHQIVYEYAGSAGFVSLTYENAQGNTEQKGSVPNKSSISLGVIPCGSFVYISSQNQGDAGSVTCDIKADGHVIEHARSEGAYVIATCSGSVPR